VPLGVSRTVTGMLNVPALSFTVSLPVRNCTFRLGDGQRVNRGTAQEGAPRGRAQGQCQRLGGAGSERSVPVMSRSGLPIPNVSGLAVTPL